jgi:toxin ParE1/3/4
MEIKWLRLSLIDIDEIFEFIAQENPTAATETVDKIWLGAQILRHFQDSDRDGRVPGTRELYIVDTYYILPYRVINNKIEILRVMHTSRDWPKSFNS